MGRSWWMLLAAGCSAGGGGQGSFGGDDGGASTGSAVTSGASDTDPETGGVDTGASSGDPDGTSGGILFDVGDTGGAVGDLCTVDPDGQDAVGPCTDVAPPDSFDPEVQWEWWGPGDETQSSALPLVANLTDDNGDGNIDLCDVPDVVVVASDTYAQADGHIHVLSGADGSLHFTIPQAVSATVTPALGDIDGDGLPETVTSWDESSSGQEFRVVAFEHDGEVAWMTEPFPYYGHGYSVALADLDADGTVEIVLGSLVLNADGTQRFLGGEAEIGTVGLTAAVPIDLDDDGALEVVMGGIAYRDGGAVYYDTGVVGTSFPQVADLDDDGLPEVLVTNSGGVTLLEHDGTIVFQDLTPTGDEPNGLTWGRPATIHDFDGDMMPEFAMSSGNHYSVFESDASVVWSADVLDQSGVAAGTAFDFLGDGFPEAMYADETNLFVYDGAGEALITVPRSSWTNLEFPVVVDVDNDGSAEVLVISSRYHPEERQTAPTLQVIRDAEDRWIPARRIWNQHAYHVTNVREDGTIPAVQPKHWLELNTFRTQAQIDPAGGGICQPVPEG